MPPKSRPSSASTAKKTISSRPSSAKKTIPPAATSAAILRRRTRPSLPPIGPAASIPPPSGRGRAITKATSSLSSLFNGERSVRRSLSNLDDVSYHLKNLIVLFHIPLAVLEIVAEYAVIYSRLYLIGIPYNGRDQLPEIFVMNAPITSLVTCEWKRVIPPNLPTWDSINGAQMVVTSNALYIYDRRLILVLPIDGNSIPIPPPPPPSSSSSPSPSSSSTTVNGYVTLTDVDAGEPNGWKRIDGTNLTVRGHNDGRSVLIDNRYWFHWGRPLGTSDDVCHAEVLDLTTYHQWTVSPWSPTTPTYPYADTTPRDIIPAFTNAVVYGSLVYAFYATKRKQYTACYNHMTRTWKKLSINQSYATISSHDYRGCIAIPKFGILLIGNAPSDDDKKQLVPITYLYQPLSDTYLPLSWVWPKPSYPIDPFFKIPRSIVYIDGTLVYMVRSKDFKSTQCWILKRSSMFIRNQQTSEQQQSTTAAAATWSLNRHIKANHWRVMAGVDQRVPITTCVFEH
jgi:hypothetical protein